VYVAAALRQHLDRDAGLAVQCGGPRGWDALLYLCNARIAPRTSWDPLACARLLLGHGADPKTHALADQMHIRPSGVPVASVRQARLQRRHTCRARALVELLLDPGADPNDEQALYNVHYGTFCATRDGSSCCSRRDLGSRSSSTICWANR